MRFAFAQQAPPAPQLQQQAQELLAQLRDIQEPAPVSWWPPAPGWWLLGILLIALTGAAAWFLHKQRTKRTRNRYRIEAVRLLRNVDLNDAAAAQKINEFLKRVAVTTFSRSICGNLTGQRWVDFLRATAEVEMPASVSDILLQHLYRAEERALVDYRHLLDYAIQWVEAHSAMVPPKRQQMQAEASGV